MEGEVRDVIKVLLVYIAVFALIWIIVFRELLVRGVISGGG
jgi:hypothetical protein